MQVWRGGEDSGRTSNDDWIVSTDLIAKDG